MEREIAKWVHHEQLIRRPITTCASALLRKKEMPICCIVYKHLKLQVFTVQLNAAHRGNLICRTFHSPEQTEHLPWTPSYTLMYE